MTMIYIRRFLASGTHTLINLLYNVFFHKIYIKTTPKGVQLKKTGRSKIEPPTQTNNYTTLNIQRPNRTDNIDLVTSSERNFKWRL